MGSSASCSFVLSPTDKSFYLTREIISGLAILTVNNSIKIKSVNLNVVGYFKRRIVNSDHNGTNYHTNVDQFFSQNYPLSISTGNGISYYKNGYHIEPNTYEWPFSVQLPKNLPPSLQYTDLYIPYIEYYLTIRITRSWYHSNIFSEIPITIYPHIRPPRSIRSTIRKESNFNDLHIYGKLLRTYLLFEEPFIILEFSVKNPSHIVIERIDVTLYQHRTLAGEYGRNIVFEYALPDIVNFQGEHFHGTFPVFVTCGIDSLAPTSYYRHRNSSTKPWTVQYVIEVTLRTRSFMTNISLKFPIIVANIKRQSRKALINTRFISILNRIRNFRQ